MEKVDEQYEGSAMQSMGDAVPDVKDGEAFTSPPQAASTKLEPDNWRKHITPVLDTVQAAQRDVNAANLSDVESQILLAELKNIQFAVIEAQRNTSHAVEAESNVCAACCWYVLVCFVLTFAQWHGLVASVPKSSDKEYCWDLSAMAGLVWATVRVWIAAKISKHKILPALFPQTHTVMAMDRKLKSIGNIVKATARLGAMCFMTALWAKFTFSGGLEMSFSNSEPYTQCEVWSDAVSRRIFYNAKFLLIAVMMWELSSLQGLSWDMWLHHLVVIFAMVATTDSALLVPSDAESYALMNGFALIVMYGTAFVGLKELAVAKFQHCTPLEMAKQFVWLRWAVGIHIVNQAFFYFLIPVIYVIMATELSVGRIVLLWLVIVALNGLEVYIGYVTVVVMLGRMKRAGIPSVFSCVKY